MIGMPVGRLEIAALIVRRCRIEGEEAQRAGQSRDECPYGADLDLERYGWIDGHDRAAKGASS